MALTRAATAGAPVLLQAEGITKQFGGTLALDDVDLAVRAGEVNILLGENGAGKSTLVKIMVGAVAPDAGRLLLDGEAVSFASPRDALARGIGVIHQEFSLFPNLSVIDNLFAGRELVHGRVRVDHKAEEQRTEGLIARLAVSIEPSILVGRLHVADQQLVEIARALSRDVRVLVMDEPTSALGAAETRVLFRIIEELKARGVAIVYISHKLSEIFEIGDRVTILRDGRIVGSAQAADVDPGWIVSKMIGRPLGSLFAARSGTRGEELLKVTSLCVADPATPSRLAVDDVSFSVYAGEILGLYGLRGAGQHELVDCLVGRVPASSGRASLLERPILDRSIGERLAMGLAFVPEDRQRDGLVPKMSIASNLTLASLGAQVRKFWLDRVVERRRVGSMFRQLDIRGGAPSDPVDSLSGGNQQKVVVGRALLTAPKVLLLYDPTRGVDVGAKAELFRTMADLASRGFGIVLVSSELDELLAMTDRIIVMAQGRLVAEFNQQTANEEKLVVAASGDGAGGRAA